MATLQQWVNCCGRLDQSKCDAYRERHPELTPEPCQEPPVGSQEKPAAVAMQQPNWQHVGAALHDILVECGITPKQNCGCTAWINRMNAWGVAGCEQHRDEILAHLADAAKSAGWLSMAKVALHGYMTSGQLLDAAIRRVS